jgi:hypothetical protein
MLHEEAPCTCGLLYGSCGGGCSLLFAGGHHHYYKQCGDGEAGAFGGGPYGGSSVDCTLSLGTPSTRRAEATGGRGMYWEQPGCNGNSRQHQESAAAAPANASARRCANCDTTSTPLWRNGPRGPKVRANAPYPAGPALWLDRSFRLLSYILNLRARCLVRMLNNHLLPVQSLCNACGIRYKKEERRAAAAAVAPTTVPASDGGMEYAAYGYAARQPQQWGCYGPAAASFGMFGDAGAEDGPCLPWGLGVMPPSPAFGASVREMPSLFQYY